MVVDLLLHLIISHLLLDMTIIAVLKQLVDLQHVGRVFLFLFTIGFLSHVRLDTMLNELHASEFLVNLDVLDKILCLFRG